MASAGGLPPPAGAGRWKVACKGKWVEQTVQIRHRVERQDGLVREQVSGNRSGISDWQE